jgi:DNA-binding transcriptional LysR family regulator
MASSVSQPPALFDWALARSFLAVLDAGSLMGAARQLGMHQPTLSRHIAELEAQLGVPLFERTGRGAAPTAMALALADGARQMQTGADALAQAATRTRSAPSGTVRVSASEVAATWLLAPLLARLAAEEPGLQVELVVSNQLSNLLKREADIALRMLRPAQTSLTARKLGEVAITACAHERYLASAGTPRRPDDLAHHRLIGYDRDDTIVRGFARLGFPINRSQFALRTDNQVAYGQWVAAGAGIGFLARYHAALLPGVRTLLPALRIPPLPCWLAVHREIRGNRLVRRVWDYLAEAVPAAVAEGESRSR